VAGGAPFPLIVVTAYDDYALQAFERAAIDYLLKPVSQDRLAVTVARLQGLLAQRAGSGQDSHLERALAQLRALSAPTVDDAPPRLDYIRAAVGNQVKMIPVHEVIYFEATDKYVNVVSAEGRR
jgi:DNA-binding LytR/AlgR family response regulator